MYGQGPFRTGAQNPLVPSISGNCRRGREHPAEGSLFLHHLSSLSSSLCLEFSWFRGSPPPSLFHPWFGCFGPGVQIGLGAGVLVVCRNHRRLQHQRAQSGGVPPAPTTSQGGDTRLGIKEVINVWKWDHRCQVSDPCGRDRRIRVCVRASDSP